jgi:4-amino-4-deoxy-L-arabinose transferase-like glycosyltransferase
MGVGSRGSSVRSEVPPTIADLPTARVDAWLAARRGRVLGGLLVAAVVIRLAISLQIAGGPLPRVHEIIPQSDNRFFHQWGQRVASGDLLQREPWFQKQEWMRAVALRAVAEHPSLPRELGITLEPGADPDALAWRIWERWLGGATFFQEPLYPYLVGLTYRIAGPKPWAVFAWQLAVGALGVLLVWSLARRLCSDSAALAAGVLAVLAPIPMMYELALLRDGLVAYATLALALAMAWAPNGRPGRWFVLGALFGGALLLKQTFWAFPVLFALWRLATVRSPLRDRAAAMGLTVAGMALALAPAMIRNVVVGVPLLALNGSGAAMIASYHTAAAPPFGFDDTADLSGVLAASGGRFIDSLVAAARTHPTLLGFVALNLKKLLFIWHGFEAPNNVDFYLFRQASWVLAALPATLVALLPLAVTGTFAARSRAGPLVVAVVGSIPTMLIGAVLSRYRAPFTAALIPLAGAGCVQLVTWLARRRWVAIASAATGTALYLAWAIPAPPGQEVALRASGYAAIGQRVMNRGEPAYASLALEESLRLAPDDAVVRWTLGRALLASGDSRGAVPQLETAARGLNRADAYEELGYLLASQGRFDESRAALRSSLALDPSRAYARGLLGELDARATGSSPRR